jgi:hypothetical protein
MKRTFASLALVGVTWVAVGSEAMASGIDPGSLLVYPCYDNRNGAISIVSVANTHDFGSIAVEFIYINGDTCLEFNRTVLLTPKDIYSAVTRFHNPNADEGYVYAFAKSPTTNQAVVWDHLVGTMQIHTGLNQISFEAMPFVFRSAARTRGNEGMATDLPPIGDNDGNRDLDGREYEQAPDVVIIPQFLGNGNLLGFNVDSELCILGLTGIRHTTIVNFGIYNDNEEFFSSQLTFDCWDRVRLTDITSAFTDSFLKSSNDNPAETQGLTEDVGWYEIDGAVAFSTIDQEVDPAFLAIQVQSLGLFRSQEGTQSFGKGLQPNGALLPVSIFGDPD